MNPARILSDIAAYRTSDLARRIRRVIEAVGLDRLGDGKVRHARLGDDTAVVIVDFKNPVELAKAEKNGIGKRQRAPRKRGAGAARHNLDALLVAPFHNGCDLLHRLRQNHRERQLAIGRQAVGIIGTHAFTRINHAVRRHKPAQLAANLVPAVDYALIGVRHQHWSHPRSVGISPRHNAKTADCQCRRTD